MCWFHVVVLQHTARTCSKLRAARAARLFFLIRPIKFLVCVVVAAVAGFNAQAPFRHITDLHQGSLNYIQRPRVSFFALSRFFSIFNHIFVNPLKNTEPGKSSHFSQAICLRHQRVPESYGRRLMTQSSHWNACKLSIGVETLKNDQCINQFHVCPPPPSGKPRAFEIQTCPHSQEFEKPAMSCNWRSIDFWSAVNNKNKTPLHLFLLSVHRK